MHWKAIKSSGQIRINVQNKDEALILTVNDNGKGMSEDELHRLGTPFHTTKENGTGLGIMMIESIIKNNHQGQISIDSKLNIGTTFIIELPFKLDEM
ncbi:signal transduction histidine kinase [Metabacillus crassostreae]|uniref:sensor histidine kinase n=1 Tax=Metabacillus crassostreae TaxID=929098 RepID=UPI00195E6D85|nr:HAMP domain-containing sensor histidine kinase [Metabacillus crassostreae]MBM7602925.1 signal transduction histidine kinase [Metabacillus crassostreae]